MGFALLVLIVIIYKCLTRNCINLQLQELLKGLFFSVLKAVLIYYFSVLTVQILGAPSKQYLKKQKQFKV